MPKGPHCLILFGILIVNLEFYQICPWCQLVNHLKNLVPVLGHFFHSLSAIVAYFDVWAWCAPCVCRRRARITSWWTRMRRAFGSGNLTKVPFRKLQSIQYFSEWRQFFFVALKKNIGTFWLVLPRWFIFVRVTLGPRTLWCIGTIFVYLPIMKCAISLEDPPPSSGSLFWRFSNNFVGHCRWGSGGSPETIQKISS